MLYTFVAMIEYYFYQSAALNMMQYAAEIDFLYHINLFDWPIEHGHKDYWEFTIMTNGQIDNCSNGKVRTYGANSVFIATTGDVHRLLASGVEPVRYINIMVKESFLQNTVERLSPGLLDYLRSDDFSLTLSGNKISEIEQILLQVNYTNPEQYKENDKFICSAFLLLVSAILFSRATTSLNISPYLVLLNQFAQNNELLTCNVNDLCKKLGYSRGQLNNLFKKHFGIAPHEYLIEYKFNHARRLLVNTNMTISEIAFAIGYANPMQFYTTFKKLFGVTPNRYRSNGHALVPQNKAQTKKEQQ